jgi:CHAT domain-containing protein
LIKGKGGNKGEVKMVKGIRVKIVVMLVLIVSAFIFGQEKQDKQDKIDKQDKQLWEEIPADPGDVYFRKGGAYSRTGCNSRALEMYDKALPFFKKAGNLTGQGDVYFGKGVIYSRVGKISRALEIYNKALPLFEKAGDLTGQGNVYFFKGDIYYISGNKSRALEMIDKALPFFEKAGYLIGQGNVYVGKGVIYLHDDEHTRALEMFDNALPFFEKAGHLSNQGNIYYRKGETYFRAGEHTRALKMIDKALPFFEKAGDPIGQGNVYYGKGVIYSWRRKKFRIFKMLDKALFYYWKAEHMRGVSKVLYSKATVLGKLSKASVFGKVEKKKKALALFEEAITKRERMRTHTASPGMKRTFMEKLYDDYQETVLFMLENKYKNQGFKYAESMKARVFLDQMAEGLVRPDKKLAPGLEEKRDKLTAKLSLLSREMHQADVEKEKKKLRELKEQYRKVKREFEDLMAKIRLNNPLYASVKYPGPVTVRTLQKEVLKGGELLLHYFISPYKLYVFIISTRMFKVVPITIKEKEIKRIVKRYLLAVEENSKREIRNYGKTLYRKLFKPLEKAIKWDKNIIIIPDGELANVPFESFITDKEEPGRPVFLLEKYRIKYMQSASLLSVLRKHYRRESDRKNFIGFGDPVYDYKNFRRGKPGQSTLTRSQGKEDEIKGIHRGRYARAGGMLNRLPHSGEEVRSIARLFAGGSSKSAVFLREEASEERAKALRMKNFDYIHFACHGLVSDDFQSLVLSQLPPDKTSEDGYLTLNEIMNCEFNAKLVVLSACQTGTGKLERGEGVTGLTRAVMYAGTPAVVASLWKVDDTAAKELMVLFYRNMMEKKMDKTEALRQAKLELLKNKKYGSVLHWSAFVMYGE